MLKVRVKSKNIYIYEKVKDWAWLNNIDIFAIEFCCESNTVESI